ncbi:hypothetical protein VTL71DRAFT_5205 [Oculimacula yallundae]|uniref:Uncharacterized protein n=1 Tax=Oculimacula yallundae TaxID=86028 RepID=A0ABR4C133_9HELO
MAAMAVDSKVYGGPTSAIPATILPPTSDWSSYSAWAIMVRNAIRMRHADPAQQLLKFDTLHNSLTNPAGDHILFSCMPPGLEKQRCIDEFMARFSWTPDTDATLELSDATVKWNYTHFGLDLSQMRRYINKTSGPLPILDSGIGSRVGSSSFEDTTPNTGGADQAIVRNSPNQFAPFRSAPPPIALGQFHFPQDRASKSVPLRSGRSSRDTTHRRTTHNQTIDLKASEQTYQPYMRPALLRDRQLQSRAKRESKKSSLSPYIEHVKSLSDHVVPSAPNRMVGESTSSDTVSCQYPVQNGARRQSVPTDYAGPANQVERQGSIIMPPPDGLGGYPMTRGNGSRPIMAGLRRQYLSDEDQERIDAMYKRKLSEDPNSPALPILRKMIP